MLLVTNKLDQKQTLEVSWLKILIIPALYILEISKLAYQ